MSKDKPEIQVEVLTNEEREKMEHNYPMGDSGQLSLATLLLLGGGGFGGFGRGGYGGGYGGGGYGGGVHAGGRASVADEVARDIFRQPSSADLSGAMGRQEERIAEGARVASANSDVLQRELSAIQRDIDDHNAQNQAQAARDNAEVQRELARCCCDTQLGIKDSSFQSQLGHAGLSKDICDQTAALLAAGTANTQAVLNQVTTQETDRLNRELSDAKAALSNAAQTNQFATMISAAVQNGVSQVTAQCCCDPCAGSKKK